MLCIFFLYIETNNISLKENEMCVKADTHYEFLPSLRSQEIRRKLSNWYLYKCSTNIGGGQEDTLSFTSAPNYRNQTFVHDTVKSIITRFISVGFSCHTCKHVRLLCEISRGTCKLTRTLTYIRKEKTRH